MIHISICNHSRQCIAGLPTGGHLWRFVDPKVGIGGTGASLFRTPIDAVSLQFRCETFRPEDFFASHRGRGIQPSSSSHRDRINLRYWDLKQLVEFPLPDAVGQLVPVLLDVVP